MDSLIQPYRYVAIRLPSDTTKVQQIVPNTTISLGKYGSFPANQIIGRPYYLTFEILDEPAAAESDAQSEQQDGSETGDPDRHCLRIVSAAELHTESLMLDGGAGPDEVDDGAGQGQDQSDRADSTVPTTSFSSRPSSQAGTTTPGPRDNRDTVDTPSTQAMTVDEIEKLKRGTTQAGQAIIAQLMQSHAALDQKTAFSLAKYQLRKRKKYLRRFSVEPLDVATLTGWMLLQKDPVRIMELSDEMLGLMGCWANVHNGGGHLPDTGRWLVVDDTGGLVVAAMAERMGILYPETTTPTPPSQSQSVLSEPAQSSSTPSRRGPIPAMSATNTTLTLLHPTSQPNLSLLKYFNFDNTDPAETHPLHAHLKTLSWMQLLSPEHDSLYANEPPVVPDETLATWKANKRGMYHRKRRRWQRVRAVVDETRGGGFDGLVVATAMDPVSVLRHAVPLLAGSAHVVVYSPTIEPLTNLSDLYSSARKSAWLALRQGRADAAGDDAGSESDFPLDPTLLFGPTVQTSRARAFQVLPGRTHPTMTARGGAVGYVFHAIRGLAAEGRVTARGQVARKKRRVDDEVEVGGSGDTAAPMPAV
ncbi:tRNA (adenine(58)-N(1))-methyltransferase non-catalytic subunit trm6 [Ascosphaera acerosa]|nr:tRNA (adenine(58)-N(1))-methyltransferase non-catalytic subunit trm6 [Ascosphaera acerosa]